MDKPRVLIIGAGFGGLSAAQTLKHAPVLLTVVDRVIVLAKGKVLADGPVREVMQTSDAWVQSYFSVRTMIGGGSETHGT